MASEAASLTAVLIGGLALTAVTVAQAAAAPSYVITDLGTLGGSTSSAAKINAAGQVVGSSALRGDGVIHAFLWDGTMHDLGTLGGPTSDATGINNRGQIIGRAAVLGDVLHPFLYAGGTMSDLSAVIGGMDSSVVDINDAGAIVGTRAPGDDGQDRCAFLLTGGSAKCLGTLGGRYSSAAAVNSSGAVVGVSEGKINSSYFTHAFLYTGGVMTDLGVLPGGSSSSAVDISDGGDVVGQADSHAFLVTGGTMHDLGSLGGDGYAAGINNRGQIVGASQTANGEHAFFYSDGTILDLNTLVTNGDGWVLQFAYRINDAGQIVGSGALNGQGHGYLLSPLGTTTTMMMVSTTTTIGSITPTSTTLPAPGACVADAQAKPKRLGKVLGTLGRKLSALEKQTERNKRLTPACRQEISHLLRGAQGSLSGLRR